MLFQIMDYSAIYWLVGLGFTVGLAFGLNYLINGDRETLFVCLLFFDSLFVWAGLLPVWTLILSFIVSFVITYYSRAHSFNPNMAIGVCLGILMLITLLSVISGNSFVSFTTSGIVDTTFLTNGTVSESDVLDQTVSFQIDALLGAIGILVLVGTVIAVVGLRIFTFGLSDTSIQTIRTSFIYGGIWGLLSVLSYALIVSIAIFGLLLYIGLTLIYIIAVFQKMGANG